MNNRANVVEVFEFNIHGDNIVECLRAFNYIISGLGNLVDEIIGPDSSVTCPVYFVRLLDRELSFRLFPGFGERRWSQDIVEYMHRSGGRLREAADAILTRVQDGEEKPFAAIEFCGALPAGNQAWQRHGRAFSFASAKIPYFYVAELGGFELVGDRKRKAVRMPNPAVPFSFIAITEYQCTLCLPVYNANAGATGDTITSFSTVFGNDDFLEYLKLAILGESTAQADQALADKCVTLVELLADSRRRNDGLSADQWRKAYRAICAGRNLPDFLLENVKLPWKKTAYIEALTDTARLFMELGSKLSLGLASSSLPLSFVPKFERLGFCESLRELYPDLSDEFSSWLGNQEEHLAIAWVMGFKPRGDDARPDRGLPPLTRMLAGEDSELMTFVYGPAPESHWRNLYRNPVFLGNANGLWEAIFAVSDAILVDSATKPASFPRAYLKADWAPVQEYQSIPLFVEDRVFQFGEQDVDTALHVAFEALGEDLVLEGMCNPPGGDWSGISFMWANGDPEYRWLTLPRVSAQGAKRPDHVFAVFTNFENTICLCIESKEKAGSLEQGIGPRLTNYVEVLFKTSPSIFRLQKDRPWSIYRNTWNPPKAVFVSAGAFLCDPREPFKGLSENTALDVQIGIAFFQDGRRCTLHMRGNTEAGEALVSDLARLPAWEDFIAIEVNS